jgi:hypothetical protein
VLSAALDFELSPASWRGNDQSRTKAAARLVTFRLLISAPPIAHRYERRVPHVVPSADRRYVVRGRRDQPLRFVMLDPDSRPGRKQRLQVSGLERRVATQ